MKVVQNEISINALIKFSDIEVPKDFIEIIREATEIEINVDQSKYIRIWGADGCIEMNEAYAIQESIPNSIAIGDKGFGLYIIAFNDLDVDELKYVSESISSLLINNVGIEVIKKC